MTGDRDVIGDHGISIGREVASRLDRAATGVAPTPVGLVHGMGTEPAEPDWRPLTGDEATAVLARFGITATEVSWHSPRPMSAAALVRHPGGTVFVKRHHTSVRTASQLLTEHAFAAHLRARGLPVPRVLRTADGRTVVSRGDDRYEVHELAPGIDLYRDALSWSPYISPGHARAAGAMLARLHGAAASFGHPARPPGVLTISCSVVTAPDPLAAVERLAGRLPGLARYLAARRWREDLTRHLLPAIARAAPALAAQEPQWAHGDWHPSNLTWTAAAPDAGVAAVLDVGLANRTCVVHDLATAIERSVVDWLGLGRASAGSGRAGTDLTALDALLDGYESVRPLTPGQAAALAAVLPVVHVEYALSEIGYFAGVVGSAANADLAYEAYLLGHARWFEGPQGTGLLAHLRWRASGQAGPARAVPAAHPAP